MDAAGFDHQVGTLQRAHAAKALGNALHDEQAHSWALTMAPRAFRFRRSAWFDAGITRARSPQRCLLVGFALTHDFLRGEVDAARRKGIADEEVVALPGIVVGP